MDLVPFVSSRKYFPNGYNSTWLHTSGCVRVPKFLITCQLDDDVIRRPSLMSLIMRRLWARSGMGIELQYLDVKTWTLDIIQIERKYSTLPSGAWLGAFTCISWFEAPFLSSFDWATVRLLTSALPTWSNTFLPFELSQPGEVRYLEEGFDRHLILCSGILASFLLYDTVQYIP